MYLNNMLFNYVTLRGISTQRRKSRPSTRRFHSYCLAVSLKVCARQTTFPVAHSWREPFIPPRDITSAVSHSALTCLLHQFMCLLLSFNDSSGTTRHAKPICHWFTSRLKSISMSKTSGRWSVNNFRTSYGWHGNSAGKVTRCGL
jgi:hypothetical protein